MAREPDRFEAFDPGTYYSDTAYTTPAELGHEKRYHRKSVFPILLWFACAAAIMASLIYMLFFYNVVVRDRNDSSGYHAGDTQASSGDQGQQFSINREDAARPEGGENDAAAYGTEKGHVLNVSGDDSAETLSLKSIYRKCAPSVVSISGCSADFSNYVLGSGIIMNSDGYIITNTHIVSDAGYINVKLYGGGEYPAYIVGEDPASGIAVVKIEASNLHPAEFGDPGSVEAGETVVSIGNPVDGSFTITDGIVSSLCGVIKYGGYPVNVFQTNAQSGKGSSGGPLINTHGQVIGIINTDMGEEYELENLSFVVPVSDAKPVVDEILEHGYVAGRPAIGLELIDIPLSAAAYYGIPMGVFVEKVYENSDACAVGLARGDIVVSINEVQISSVDELNEVKNELSVGDTVKLGVIRKRELYSVDVRLVDSSEID